MVLTRSNQGQERKAQTSSSNTEETSGSGDTETTTTTDTTGTGTTASGTTTSTERTTTTASTSTSQNTEASTATKETAIAADTSGIKATPAASMTTVIERRPPVLMPPPSATARTLKPARSRHSRAPSKKLLAEWEAKERLAELRVKRLRAEAELEEIRMKRTAAESLASDSDEEEEEDLAPQRIEDWFGGQPEEGPTIEIRQEEEKRRGQAADAPRLRTQQEPIGAPPAQVSTIDVTSLSAALREAIQVGKSTRMFIPDLPPFSGYLQDWLPFKAAYDESSASFSPNENVARLRKSLRGAALEAISALLISQPQPDEIISRLQRRFGRPDALLMSEIEKMKTLPRLTDNPRDLCVFASRIANTVTTIEVLKHPQYLYNPEVLRSIVEKMTPILRNKWYDYAAHYEGTPELVKIRNFLNIEADKCAPYAQPESIQEKQATRKKPERAYVATTEETSTKKEDRTCVMCKQEHQLPACPQFTKASTSERWQIAKKNNVCYRCLVSKHRRIACRVRPCGVSGCTMRHHRLLHHERTPSTTEQPSSHNKTEQVVASAVEKVAGTATKSSRAYLKIVPVVLSGPRAELETYALLDEGSTVTIIDSVVADTLGLDGPNEPMRVQGVSGKEIEHKKSKRVDVRVRGKYNTEELLIRNAHTVASLDFTTQSIRKEEIRGCSHLGDVPQELLYNNATPKILIGQDNWEIIVSREIKEGRRDQLVASKTLLGWVLHGCRTTRAKPTAFCGHLSRPTEQIEDIMKQYFTLESLSIEPRRQKSDPELQALKILEERSRRLPDGRYETGLLWRDGVEKIPNNKQDALKRLHTLEKKLDKDEKLKQQYNERVDNMLLSQYAERVTTPPSNKTWYLPHFAVCNPEKQKIRVVHDAAARSHGRSLNDMLLPGPDLLQSLPGVIMRFRQHQIAVSADIKEMFMQIKIRHEDRDALRFLWRGDRREGEPDEYRMTSVIFGASSSPCTALYVKNKNAQEHADKFPEAAEAIEKNHYMDDYLQSFKTTEDAVRITRDVDHVHRKAGFQLRGWATNKREAVNAVTTRPGPGEATVPIGGSEVEKTLGLLWDTVGDHIRFRLNTGRAPTDVVEGRRAPTKREALSIIMSIFDPLGLISPVTTPAKRIMQDTWRHGTGWDDDIPEELCDRWDKWRQQLLHLSDIAIPRCYDEQPATRYEMHTFVDASEEAYAAATYWRMTRADGTVKVALAAAKSRVTPTKPISIPRLELQAAVLGVRIAKTVGDEHDFDVSRRVYWSDSRTALAWIRSEPRTFKTFVAHRLAEIEDHTKKDEWRWLPSSDNVADDATRATPEDFGALHRWYTGPSFLYGPEETWPIENKEPAIATGEEKNTCCALQEDTRRGHAHLPELQRFSKWNRLLRATARVLQFVDLCRRRAEPATPKPAIVAATRRKRTRAHPDADGTWQQRKQRPGPAKKIVTDVGRAKYITLDAKYISAAEKLWIRASQEDSYGDEITRLRNKSAPTKSDRLAKLSVYLDENSVIRLRGRIAAAENVDEETAHPVVLHGKHPYTKLYITHVHEKMHHGGTETVVNELRQRMHITKIRPAVKEAIAHCAPCRMKKAKPAAPITGDLPAARLAHHSRPFTHTGLDYFGPIEVTVARHREKRYVALFTCMTSRAVHLEVVASLSADSAINALRRFIARRGCPAELWSDNATAFRSADRVLVEAMEEEASARRINWRFLPPAAPFMAGAWERMVRTVKEALKTTLHEKSPSDETLHTLLTEVEATVNSRPLTHVAVHPDDPPALTPNMILIGPDCHTPPPGVFTEQDADARQHWRRAQHLADVFWRRWVREYLPLLQHRREPHGVGTPPAVGDLVLIGDSNLPRNTWPRGRVTKTYPGQDGVTRVVDVTTSRGHVLRRPTKKIVVIQKGSLSDGGRNVDDET